MSILRNAADYQRTPLGFSLFNKYVLLGPFALPVFQIIKYRFDGQTMLRPDVKACQHKSSQMHEDLVE